MLFFISIDIILFVNFAIRHFFVSFICQRQKGKFKSISIQRVQQVLVGENFSKKVTLAGGGGWYSSRIREPA
jgi:hypothetical protein